MPTSRRNLMLLGVLGAAMLCPVAACSADRSDGKQPVRAGHPTTPHSATAAGRGAPAEEESPTG
ncbi:hypothetical protein [Streptomyces griseoluteus]|uniref:hypothetical protein n=1 Tax=Streptomyces griseoluteus TaxID=29306 RepID=UPI0036F4D16A